MTGPEGGVSHRDESRRSARAVLGVAWRVYFVFAGMSIATLSYAFLREAGKFNVNQRTRGYMNALLIFLFFAATAVNLGIQWAAKIIAARRYSVKQPLRMAAPVAIAQIAAFVVYGMVVALVVYYRLVAGADTAAAAPALASVLGGLYFLRLPRFVLKSLYGSESGGDGGDDNKG